SLSLHRDTIPVSSSGLGTRRLLGLAIQSLAVADGAVLLIDEIESGLEPHRLRHLIRFLRNATVRNAADAGEEGDSDAVMRAGQVFLTTHSPVAVCELYSPEVHVVRSTDERLSIRSAREELQALVRSHPEALLGRSALVCEGKTEVGLIRGLESMWTSRNGGTPLAEKGVVVAEGGGTDKAAGVALRMAELGYRCAFFGDSDRDPNPTVAELEEAGVHVVRWDGSLCTEERIANDLPAETLKALLDYLIETHGAHVLNLVADELEIDGDESPYDYFGIHYVDEIREAIAVTSVQHNWMKRIDYAEGVGKLLASAWTDLEGTDLAAKLTEVQAWAYA
ncbi:MAG: ATP-dependent endonuclease, partial [Acidimicrobiales bacterium]